jgi:hypothetical protein
MLTLPDFEKLFAANRTPEAGRKLIREVFTNAPVRALQHRADTVRTRFVSKKMARAMLAESRTVELPAFVMSEISEAVLFFVAQPCRLDMQMAGIAGGVTRVQHTPDIFLVENNLFFLDEWHTEARMRQLAEKYPHRFKKDDHGRWHDLCAEPHCVTLGITHRLRSADELPRVLLANTRFLEDFSREDAPVVPPEVTLALVALLAEKKRVPYLELVYERKFQADHVLPLILSGQLYVDLQNSKCSDVDNLVVYASPLIAKADALLLAEKSKEMPSCALELRPGSRFVYDNKVYTVALVGAEKVFVKDEAGNTADMTLELVEKLHKEAVIDAGSGQKTTVEYDLERIVANESALQEALHRIEVLNNADVAEVPARTMRRWAAAADEVEGTAQLLEALAPRRGGNTTARLPPEAIELALQATNKGPYRHNRAANPTVATTYSNYIVICDAAGIVPMGRSTFYEWIQDHEDVTAREGRRAAYQKAPIPLTFDYDDPVHGVQPHEVVYCDHTPINMLTKGMRLPELGRLTLTLMTDGALSMPRAFALMYRPASTVSVLMCLRDYVRRWGRLPRVLVLDNGKEFHAHALAAICSLFGIDIRWRRRSKPRDSTLIERAIGVTEQELFSALDGNTLALKNPRNMSPEVNPGNFIKWTLPALHGALNDFLFDTQANRVHPRFGMSPAAWERRLLLEFGSRSHRLVRMDQAFKLLTSPHPKVRPTRELDRRKGVFVDGKYYWNDRFATSTRKLENVEVRIELWHASVVYVNFQGNWLIAQARDGSRLDGRFDREVEMLKREESCQLPAAAAADRTSLPHALKKLRQLEPQHWDERLREQCMEEYLLYSKLGMTEALPAAVNPRALEYDLGMPRTSDLPLMEAIDKELGVDAAKQGDAPAVADAGAGAGAAPADGVAPPGQAEEEAVTDDDFL